MTKALIASGRIGVLVAVLLGSTLRSAVSFTVVNPKTSRCVNIIFRSSSPDNSDMSFPDPNEKSGAQKEQEMMFESMSLKGADVIAKMEVPERAKRAMLAEAVEDRIFELTEKLEGFIDENGMIPEQDREKAVEIAKQTKGLQAQYNELVSGGPSAILDSLSSIKSSSED